MSARQCSKVVVYLNKLLIGYRIYRQALKSHSKLIDMKIFTHVKRLTVEPPQTTTVTITMTNVDVSIICRASVSVFLMAKAKAMAPRSPDKNIICCRLQVILDLRPRLSRNDNG